MNRFQCGNADVKNLKNQITHRLVLTHKIFLTICPKTTNISLP